MEIQSTRTVQDLYMGGTRRIKYIELITPTGQQLVQVVVQQVNLYDKHGNVEANKGNNIDIKT